MAVDLRNEINNISKTNEQLQKKQLIDQKKLDEEKLKIRIAAEKKFRTVQANFDKEQEKFLYDSYAKYEQYRSKLDKKSAKERQDALKEEIKILEKSGNKMAALASGVKLAGSIAAESAIRAVQSTLNATTKGVEDYLSIYSKYMTGIETRLQDSGKSFSDITSLISSQIGASPYVRQSAVLDNLSKLVEAGIVYNLEQRAFLATISDKIATTFDAANGTLLQLIRIQQADTTAARLGLEVGLTKFFNKMFGDTSYLSDTFDTVSATLLGATSQAGYKGGVELEFAAQKWLGSLGSVGVSQETLTSLARGLSSLATGDISGLSGTTLERLFLMSGLDYGSTLIGGLTASTVNDLMKNVIQTLQSVAKTNNQVVKAQYASLFGVTMADLTAIVNLTSKDLVNISKNMLTYADTISTLENSIATIPNRLSLKSKIDNVFDNIMTSVGENIANNAVAYTTYIMTDLVEKATGGITNIEVAPFGVGISTSVTQLIKTGIVGISLLTEIPGIIQGLFGSKGLTLNNWGASDTTSRGTGFTSIRATGSTVTTSQSTFIGNESESDIFAGSVAGVQESSAQVVGDEENDMLKIIRDDIKMDVKDILNVLRSIDSFVRFEYSGA